MGKSSKKRFSPESVKFIGGPYGPPSVPKSGVLRCVLRGWLKVDGYSSGLIPWPRGKQGAFIVCGDLVKALRTESLAAVEYHWGVSHDTVSMWRKRLGIERFTPGTWRLFWNVVNAARTPEARAKMSRQREGRKDPMTKADRERLRAIQRRPKPEAWKRMMSEKMKRRCAVLGPFEKWLPEEAAMFGIVPDREIARITGRSLSAVKGKKFALLKARKTGS
jgi:hypothetical protein